MGVLLLLWRPSPVARRPSIPPARALYCKKNQLLCVRASSSFLSSVYAVLTFCMIKCFIVVNNTGVPRLTKFYEHCTPERQQELVRNVFEALHSRADGLCNFVEDAKRFGKGVKLIYRHFATLYFAALVDENESELGILDLIHVFVETLDSCFENVCELDLVFNSGKAYAVLDEIIMAGAVIETSSQ